MIDWVDNERPNRVVMITECSMADNVKVNFPEVEFTQPCNLCPHMQRITLDKIRISLQDLVYKVEVDPGVAERARLAVQRMLALGDTRD